MHVFFLLFLNSKAKQGHANAMPIKSTGKLMKHTAETTLWGKSRTYMWRQVLKILAGHTMNHHMVAAEGRPTSCCPLVISALASACIFCFWPILYFLLSANIILYFWADWANNPYFQLPCNLIDIFDGNRLFCILHQLILWEIGPLKHNMRKQY